MFLTRVLCAPKSKYVLITVQSTVSGHEFCCLRERKEEKKEFVWFDPLIRKSVVYVETKKMKSINNCRNYKPNSNTEIEKIKLADPFNP
ncbi:hypothetical protein PGB90_009195 [Kerria lacca]